MQHHAALPWAEVAAFIAELHAQPGVAARALEFTILTAARTGETLGATWPEIDFDAAIWTVPAERMKAEREHRVPLSLAAVEMLHRLLPLRGAKGGGDWVFPGSRAGKPLATCR